MIKMSQMYARVSMILSGMFLIGICNAFGQGSVYMAPCDIRTEISYEFPLKQPEANRRYLTDQNGKPFFWSGDAAWSLIAQLSREDAEFYLDNRKEKGFTVILVNLIEHKFSSNAPANFYGDMPFAEKPFATPNEKYFEHADFVIRAASERNITVLLAPVYLGYNCGDEGWCSEVKSATNEEMRLWGRYLGKRYRNFSNIIWLMGADTDPTPVQDKILEVVIGIREFDTLHLFSAHNQPESMAVDPWQNESWMSVNNVYSYDSTIYRYYKEAYNHVPVMPFYMIESTYENEHQSTALQLRSQSYWALLSGAMGHIFGNCPVWHFGSFGTWCKLADWKSELNNSGSASMDYLQRLFRSRSWEKLVPDFDHRVLTSGFGTWGFKDYATAAYTSDSTTIIAYLPSKRTVTIDMTRIKGKRARGWWFDPASGKADYIGVFRSAGTRDFTPSAEGDQVLVIDCDSANLPVPGITL